MVLVLLNLMWGGSLPATKVALADMGPYTLTAARLLLATLLFAPLLLPALRGLTAGEALRLAALGVIGFTGTQALQAIGTAGTTASAASILAATGPLWIALLAPPILGELARPRAAFGLVLALAGVALIVDPSLGGAPPADRVFAGVIVLCSSLAFSLYSVLGTRSGRRHSPIVLTGVSCLGGMLAAVPLAALEVSAAPPSPTVLGWAMVAYLGIGVTFVGFLAWFWALRVVPAARAGALLFLQPPTGVALSALLLGDPLGPVFIAGTVLVVGGAYLAARH